MVLYCKEGDILVRGRLSEEEKKIISDLRNRSESYNQIAKVLNCKVSRVKEYCRSNDLGGFNKNTKRDPKNSFKVFLEDLKNKTNNELEYISGYTCCDSNVLLRCKKCGNEYIKSAQFVRRDREYRQCSNCLDLQKEKDKQEALKEREFKNKKLELIKLLKRIKDIKGRTITKNCVECNKEFTTTNKRTKLCSEKCKRKYGNRYGYLRRRRKLKENGEIDYSITLEKLLKRDKNLCKICGKKVNKKDFKYTEEGHFITGETYPSIDHILPVAKGGTHTWDNIQLAHRGCNTLKKDNITDPIQLKLC